MTNYSKISRSISKTLSANDTGITGAHQAGMHIPKTEGILKFFPPLGNTIKNPRILLKFIDDDGKLWEFAFIYYNNIFFGGTRNEFRLTRMTNYISSNNLKPGDELIFCYQEDGIGKVSYKRQVQQVSGKLRLGNEWKVIHI